MKIPTYTNKARASNDAPGRPFGSRMNATPFIQAALAEGKVVGALSAEVGAYALQRQKMIANAEYNNNALAIEESIREATFDLSKSSDIGNIFQGGNLWQKRMDRIRKDVLGNIQNSNVQRKLDFSFNQSEIQSRFQLQTVVDRKIIAAEQAAIGARQAQAVADLSQVGASIAQYEALFGQVNESQADGVTSGRFSPAAISTSNLKMRKDIASNYLANAYGSDVNAMMNLFSYVNKLDDVAKSGNLALPAILRSQLGDAYAGFILEQLPMKDAFAVIDEQWKDAIDRSDRFEKINKSNLNYVKTKNKEAFNLAFSGDNYIPRAQLENVMGDAAVLALIKKVGPESVRFMVSEEGDETQDQEIAAVDARLAIYNYLSAQNFLNPTDRAALLKVTQVVGGRSFAQTRNDHAYSTYYQQALSGMLSIETLNSDFVMAQITDEDHRALSAIVFNESDENVGSISKQIARHFRYNAARQTIEGNDTLGKASKAAFEVVDGQLQIFAFQRKAGLIAGGPATAEDLFGEKERLIRAQDVIFQLALKEEYVETLNRIAQPRAGLNLDGNKPLSETIADIQNWAQSADLNADELNIIARTITGLESTYSGINQ
mgnify:FL=1